MSTRKDYTITFRVSKELNDRFNSLCRKKALNKTELLTRLIEKTLKEDTNNAK